MLFNTAGFIFVFMPLVLLGLQLCAGRPQWAVGLLAAASLIFYAQLGSQYLPIMLASILFNYLIGRKIARSAGRPQGVAPHLLHLGIAANLLLLGLYKYADFILVSLTRSGLPSLPPLDLALPLGISFFTFTQIAYLVDVARGQSREYRFGHYLLFVTYFPHLIAGPILHHREMVKQFGRRLGLGLRSATLAPGLTLFAIGLSKKVLLADSLAPFADHTFAAIANGQTLTAAEAWVGLLAYTFQLYFDFSGYTDMALGLSLMLNLRLPINFDSPYRASSLIDFWRRWHITLSRFLRDYLYTPLGGNRRGPKRRYCNLIATMLLGGLWHGAGWTYLAWGAYHGLLLAANHTWRDCALPRPPQLVAIPLTFLLVALGWVLFRAPHLGAALNYYAALTPKGATPYGISHLAHLAQPASIVTGLAVCTLIVCTLPNATQYLAQARPALGKLRMPAPSPLTWQARWPHALLTAALLAASLVMLNRPSPFLYFQF